MPPHPAGMWGSRGRATSRCTWRASSSATSWTWTRRLRCGRATRKVWDACYKDPSALANSTSESSTPSSSACMHSFKAASWHVVSSDVQAAGTSQWARGARLCTGGPPPRWVGPIYFMQFAALMCVKEHKAEGWPGPPIHIMVHQF